MDCLFFMARASLTAEGLAALKTTDNLFRLLVGLESEKDIVADLDQSFQATLKKLCHKINTTGVRVKYICDLYNINNLIILILYYWFI